MSLILSTMTQLMNFNTLLHSETYCHFQNHHYIHVIGLRTILLEGKNFELRETNPPW